MHEDQDIIDVEDDNLEDTDVIDAQDSPAVTCRALKTRPASAGAVVPYQPARLPAVIPQLGVYVEPGVRYYIDNGSRIENYYKDKPVSFSLQLGLRLNIE